MGKPLYLQDGVAAWFKCLRAHGEIPDILIGRSADGHTIEWRAYPHEYFDAVGAFLSAMRQMGYDAPLKELAARLERVRASRRGRDKSAETKPASRDEDADAGGGGGLRFSGGDDGRLSRVARVKCWLRRFTQDVKPALDQSPPWRDWDDTIPSALVAPAAGILTREQTKAIHVAARKHGATPNSYMLWALDQCIGELLIDPWGPRHWVVGVNMRGSIPDLARDTANYSSGVYPRTKPGYSPKDVHDATRDEFRRGVHLAQWVKQRAVARMGTHITGLAVRRRLGRVGYATAALSYGGAWPPVPVRTPPPHGDAEQWFASGVPSRFCPILAGTLEWYGRMSLTLVIHPAMKDAEIKARQTMLRWREKLIEGT